MSGVTGEIGFSCTLDGFLVTPSSVGLAADLGLRVTFALLLLGRGGLRGSISSDNSSALVVAKVRARLRALEGSGWGDTARFLFDF